MGEFAGYGFDTGRMGAEDAVTSLEAGGNDAWTVPGKFGVGEAVSCDFVFPIA
jgi:hypothetical protein